jgi:hypothetical protein
MRAFASMSTTAARMVLTEVTRDNETLRFGRERSTFLHVETVDADGKALSKYACGVEFDALWPRNGCYNAQSLEAAVHVLRCMAQKKWCDALMPSAWDNRGGEVNGTLACIDLLWIPGSLTQGIQLYLRAAARPREPAAGPAAGPAAALAKPGFELEVVSRGSGTSMTSWPVDVFGDGIAALAAWLLKQAKAYVPLCTEPPFAVLLLKSFEPRVYAPPAATSAATRTPAFSDLFAAALSEVGISEAGRAALRVPGSLRWDPRVIAAVFRVGIANVGAEGCTWQLQSVPAAAKLGLRKSSSGSGPTDSFVFGDGGSNGLETLSWSHEHFLANVFQDMFKRRSRRVGPDPTWSWGYSEDDILSAKAAEMDAMTRAVDFVRGVYVRTLSA